MIDAPTAVDLLGEVAEAMRHVHSRVDEKGAIAAAQYNVKAASTASAIQKLIEANS